MEKFLKCYSHPPFQIFISRAGIIVAIIVIAIALSGCEKSQNIPAPPRPLTPETHLLRHLPPQMFARVVDALIAQAGAKNSGDYESIQRPQAG